MSFNPIRRVLETLGDAASGRNAAAAKQKPDTEEDVVGAASPHFAEMYRSIDAAFGEPKDGQGPASFLAARTGRDSGWPARNDVIARRPHLSPVEQERRVMSAAPYRALTLVADEARPREAPDDSAAALFEAAREAMAMSHSPYSHFPVGAALRSETGAVYSGCNIENASFPEGWCAETSAIAHMVTAGERRIVEIAVVAEKMTSITPCGGCRQRILEFGNSDTRIHLCDAKGVVETLTLAELFPRSF